MFPVNLQLSQYLFSQWSLWDKNTKRTMTVFIVFMSTRNTFEIQLTSQIYRDVGPHSSNCGSIKSDLTLCFLISKLNTWSVSFLSQPWNQRTVIKFIIHVIFTDQKLRHPWFTFVHVSFFQYIQSCLLVQWYFRNRRPS